MNKTTWGISLLDRRLPDSASYPGSEVTAIHWFAYQMAGKYTVSTSGIVELAPADRKKWVPYLSLNKETVMGWCKDALTSDRVKEIENNFLMTLCMDCHESRQSEEGDAKLMVAQISSMMDANEFHDFVSRLAGIVCMKRSQKGIK